MRIIGLDLSLTKTGMITAISDTFPLPDGEEGEMLEPIGNVGVIEHLIETKKLRGAERMQYIRSAVDESIRTISPGSFTEVYLEGPSFGSQSSYAHEMGGLWWCIRMMLWEHHNGIPVIVVPPKTLKKFATGNGNAGKPQMLAAAIRRLNFESTDDNLVDARWLAEIGLQVGGLPSYKHPKVSLTALEKLELPNADCNDARSAK